jgi:hypothetical protein
LQQLWKDNPRWSAHTQLPLHDAQANPFAAKHFKERRFVQVLERWRLVSLVDWTLHLVADSFSLKSYKMQKILFMPKKM